MAAVCCGLIGREDAQSELSFRSCLTRLLPTDLVQILHDDKVWNPFGNGNRFLLDANHSNKQENKAGGSYTFTRAAQPSSYFLSGDNCVALSHHSSLASLLSQTSEQDRSKSSFCGLPFASERNETFPANHEHQHYCCHPQQQRHRHQQRHRSFPFRQKRDGGHVGKRWW